jgi:hypothetical protein
MGRVRRIRSRPYKFPAGYRKSQFDAASPVILADNSSSSVREFWDDGSIGFPTTETWWTASIMESFSIRPVNGEFHNSPNSYGEFKDYYPSRYKADLGDTPLYWNMDPQCTTAIANMVQARSNPNRPDYVVGTLLQDLWSLPSLLKSIGDGLRNGRSPIGLHGVANNALAAKFGWLPLMDDITKLLQVKQKIAQRNLELKNLFEKGGTRKRLPLGTNTTVYDTSAYPESGYPLNMVATQNDTAKCRQWAVQYWKNQSSFPFGSPSDIERLKLAQKLVFGISASGAFASSWDLIPWTWLLGWVTDLRSYVLAHGNTVPVTPGSNAFLMTECTFTRSFNRVNLFNSKLSGGDGDVRYRQYKRTSSAGGLPTAYLPHIDAGRLSTLALLAVQRLR